MNDEITDVTYDGQPIQRQSVHVEPFPVGPKYDDDYDRFYEEFCEEYKDKYDLRDVDFDVLLIKEKYSYTKKEDPKPIEGKEEKTITRTINVHLPNGEVQTTKQPVTIKRTYTSVAGSDKKLIVSGLRVYGNISVLLKSMVTLLFLLLLMKSR